ncbi:flagellar hook-length control protein FliK [Halodesulfovibrio marinisediminis]|uniref:Hook-length control protein FliK n=1 Tax=Halodesulfovibrio marinisediminis DSM 17456 TaxID=1121457 RepID=A0A1N6I6B4_9BACT|nr:flagellar hook-length control protein FliK [Halodesulfovibrio marinisediminis]SIO27550.1 hook-length control protein FliK [Halodesulfovibrio marinisediminis DSM 17456]
MQISPTAYVTKQVKNFSTAGSAGTDFNAIFETVQKNSEKYRASKNQAHKTETQSFHQGVNSIKNLPISSDDFKEIEKTLEKAGVQEDTLKRLKDQVDDQSLTWDSLFGLLKQTAQFDFKPEAGELTPGARNNISSFLQQVGIDPAKTNDILADLQAGKTDQAWSAISDALKNVDETAELSINQGELLALGKGLQLDKNTLAKLKGMVDGANEKMTSTDLKQLAALLDSSLDAQNASGEKLLEKIKQQLNPLIAKAIEGTEKISAGIHATKEEAAAQILRTDQATEKSLGLMTSVNSKDGSTSTTAQSALSSTDTQNGLTTLTAAAVASASGADSTGSDANSLLNSNQNGSGNTWMNFFNNVAVADTSSMGQSTAATMTDFLNQSTALKQTNTTILEQIQSGVFKSLRNGVSQLSLKVNAADLGPVTVLVSTKRGEVAASIRTENPEAAKAVQENIHALRASLEAQGLKVDKIDVQTGAHNHLNDQGWKDAEQHNAQQEAQQRFLAKQQFRQLKNAKQDLINGTALPPQSVHSLNGLYLVA